MPSTGIAWPAGMVVTPASVAAAALLINRLAAGDGAYGPDGLWAVTGMVAFFLMLDALVGLGGRYDLTAGALATTLAFWSLHRSLHRRKVPSHACR